jgi:hypothetical protein
MSYQPAPGDGRIDGAHERHTSRKRLGSAGGRLLFTALIACLFALSVAAVSAQAETTLYRATQVVPVPPASDYAGSGGGDGWAVAVSDTSIYNVFHHQDSITVECHLQSNAEVCAGYPKTITDGSGNGYLSQGQPGLYLDQANGHLYVHGTRSSDDTGGVVCIDTTSSAADPFCGFTELTGPGEAPPTTSREISGLSDPVLVGTHWYSFNYVAGEHKGTENELTCFDVSTGAACAGQPYAVNFPAGTVSTSDNDPTGAIGAIGSKVIIPLNTSAGSVLACFDDATQASCGGKWPVTVPYYEVGAPYPLLDSSGNTIGVCLPTGADPCFNLEGEPVATPEGMTTAITESSEWNGTALVGRLLRLLDGCELRQLPEAARRTRVALHGQPRSAAAHMHLGQLRRRAVAAAELRRLHRPGLRYGADPRADIAVRSARMQAGELRVDPGAAAGPLDVHERLGRLRRRRRQPDSRARRRGARRHRLGESRRAAAEHLDGVAPVPVHVERRLVGVGGNRADLAG